MLPSQCCKNRVLSCAQSAGRQQSVIELGDVPGRLAHGEAITYWGWSRTDAHAECSSLGRQCIYTCQGVYDSIGSKCKKRTILSVVKRSRGAADCALRYLFTSAC